MSTIDVESIRDFESESESKGSETFSPLREAVAAICAEDDEFVGVGKSAYDKADRILTLMQKGQVR